MSLLVHTYILDANREMSLLDPLEQGADLAGFERWRTTVWGSDAVRALGTSFFPVLATGDLTVLPHAIGEFLHECSVIRAKLDAIAPPGDGDRHTHEWYVDAISERLSNIEAAAERARELRGGIEIG
ncbi:hypothetical protein ACLMAJ_12710 [Nocardia sp. KC 131]|uniref:hypothetical protein n=1 Tax=Nocardia arseniciresistens TaxID=3392119 RepID=UPI00398F858E